MVYLLCVLSSLVFVRVYLLIDVCGMCGFHYEMLYGVFVLVFCRIRVSLTEGVYFCFVMYLRVVFTLSM